jgi:capsular polysaccharide biosynthesis protein
MLRKQWRIVLVFLLLGIGASATFTFSMQPQYASTSQLFVSTRQSDNISDLLQGGNFSQLRVKSYIKVATSSMTLRPVIDRLRLDTTPDQLAKRIRVEAPMDTVLINITVRDDEPRRAADIANAIGSSIATVVDAIEAPSADSRSPVTISTVRKAEPSWLPVSPNLPLNLAAGLLAGAVLGMSAAVARNALDTRIHGDRDVARVSDEVLLGAVPLTSGGARSTFISREQHDPYAEAFRKLRTNLQFVDVAGRVDSLAVTSAVQGEGKTTVAINLALALTYAGVRTVLVDADLRRPMVAESLGLVDNVGLTTVLSGRAQVDDVLQSWGGTSLKVLASGERPPNPSELLGSPAMKDLVGRLEGQFDVVIIDTPPLLPEGTSA